MTVIDYASKFIGVPYIWGGKCPLVGLDCSGFVNMVLRAYGISPAKEINAQGLHDWLMKLNAPTSGEKGMLAFFGKDLHSISHVTITINPYQMIGANSGDQTCVDLKSANARNAYVKIAKIDSRPDLVATYMPPWPDWVKFDGY